MYETRPVTSTKFSLLLSLGRCFPSSVAVIWKQLEVSLFWLKGLSLPCETNIEIGIFVDVSRTGENNRKMPVTRLLETL